MTASVPCGEAYGSKRCLRNTELDSCLASLTPSTLYIPFVAGSWAQPHHSRQPHLFASVPSYASSSLRRLTSSFVGPPPATLHTAATLACWDPADTTPPSPLAGLPTRPRGLCPSAPPHAAQVRGSSQPPARRLELLYRCTTQRRPLPPPLHLALCLCLPTLDLPDTHRSAQPAPRCRVGAALGGQPRAGRLRPASLA
jgi:hypothetical protein